MRVDRDLKRPTNNEFSTNWSARSSQGLSARVSYVYKNIRNIWGEVDAAARRVHRAVHHHRSRHRQRRRHRRRPDLADLRPPGRRAADRVYTNPEDNKPTSTPWSSRSTAASRASGCCSPPSATPGRSAALPHTASPRRCRPATLAATRIRPVDSAVRQRVRPRDLDLVELQGHRPLLAALGHRRVGLVAHAERPALRPHHQRAVPRRRRPDHPRRADHRQPLPERLDRRLPARQVVHASGRPARSRCSSTCSTCSTPARSRCSASDRRVELTAKSSRCSTRASSASACAGTSSRRRAPARGWTELNSTGGSDRSRLGLAARARHRPLSFAGSRHLSAPSPISESFPSSSFCASVAAPARCPTRLGPHLGVVLAYVLVAVAFSWPLAAPRHPPHR